MLSQLHYACHFQIRSLQPTFNRGSLLRFVRAWIANRHYLDREHPLGKTSRFFTGMDEPWAFLPGSASTLETSVCIGNGSQEVPEYWALCY